MLTWTLRLMYVCMPIVVLFGVNFYVYTYVYKSDSCISITINLDPPPTATY